MTARLTVAILLVTWTILVIGDAAAFFAARETLLKMLDDSMLACATPLLDSALNSKLPVESLVPPGDTYEIRNSSGQVTQRFQAGRQPAFKPVVIQKKFETRPDGKTYRTITEQLNGFTVIYSRPAEAFDQLIAHLIAILSSVGTFCALATGWVALKVSRAALRPITKTADVISAIDEQNLSRRIESGKLPIELVPMTDRLNEMLERLESVFLQRKQFLADAAHELRTPTAALLTTLEVALRRPRDATALQGSMHSALAEARLLRRLVDRLMEHARSDHVGRRRLEEVDVATLLHDCVRTVEPMASEKRITITTQFAEDLRLLTQPDRLQSIVLNLLTNAVEYNREAGQIQLHAEVDENHLEITVGDTGPGIPGDHLPHVFEPFYRADRQKQGDTEHLGLGLFLVHSHVQALRGTCHIESTSESGTRFMVRLPLLSQTSAGELQETAETASV